MDILIILILQIKENGISFYLFESSLIFFITLLKFLEYLSPWLNSYLGIFMLFDVILNGNFLLLPFMIVH